MSAQEYRARVAGIRLPYTTDGANLKGRFERVPLILFENRSGHVVSGAAPCIPGRAVLLSLRRRPQSTGSVPVGQLMTVPIPEGGMQFNTLQVSPAVAGQVYCWVRFGRRKTQPITARPSLHYNCR
jgi:hypothetical protein